MPVYERLQIVLSLKGLSNECEATPEYGLTLKIYMEQPRKKILNVFGFRCIAMKSQTS